MFGAADFRLCPLSSNERGASAASGVCPPRRVTVNDHNPARQPQPNYRYSAENLHPRMGLPNPRDDPGGRPTPVTQPNGTKRALEFSPPLFKGKIQKVSPGDPRGRAGGFTCRGTLRIPRFASMSSCNLVPPNCYTHHFFA